MVKIVVILLVESEVQNTDDVDTFQLVVPVSALSLFTDREGGVIDAAVLEILLQATLHFHQYLFTLLVFAIDIEHRFAVSFAGAQVFSIEVSQVCDDLFPVQQAIDETDKEFLIYFRTEKLLETEVGIRVDVSVFQVSAVHKCKE